MRAKGKEGQIPVASNRQAKAPRPYKPGVTSSDWPRHHLERDVFLAGARAGHANDEVGHIRHLQPARLKQLPPITEG